MLTSDLGNVFSNTKNSGQVTCWNSNPNRGAAKKGSQRNQQIGVFHGCEFRFTPITPKSCDIIRLAPRWLVITGGITASWKLVSLLRHGCTDNHVFFSPNPWDRKCWMWFHTLKFSAKRPAGKGINSHYRWNRNKIKSGHKYGGLEKLYPFARFEACVCTCPNTNRSKQKLESFWKYDIIGISGIILWFFGCSAHTPCEQESHPGPDFLQS